MISRALSPRTAAQHDTQQQHQQQQQPLCLRVWRQPPRGPIRRAEVAHADTRCCLLHEFAVPGGGGGSSGGGGGLAGGDCGRGDVDTASAGHNIGPEAGEGQVVVGPGGGRGETAGGGGERGVVSAGPAA